MINFKEWAHAFFSLNKCQDDFTFQLSSEVLSAAEKNTTRILCYLRNIKCNKQQWECQKFQVLNVELQKENEAMVRVYH